MVCLDQLSVPIERKRRRECIGIHCTFFTLSCRCTMIHSLTNEMDRGIVLFCGDMDPRTQMNRKMRMNGNLPRHDLALTLSLPIFAQALHLEFSPGE